ncbi:hypothetical protein JTB14_030907 [Gonioctena quinquepunctata]|nr:hypothetical protein JTB14_030907 [Gonioctena quinquepunctata]
MKTVILVFAVLLVVHVSNAYEAASPFPPAESPASLAARSFQKRDCSKDTQEGPFYCMALFWRYKWSDQVQDCVKEVYGGCHETKNNFRTIGECREVAVPVCKSN